jgi:hypothetical protein
MEPPSSSVPAVEGKNEIDPESVPVDIWDGKVLYEGEELDRLLEIPSSEFVKLPMNEASFVAFMDRVSEVRGWPEGP